MNKECLNCKSNYTTNIKNQKFCLSDCSKEYWAKKTGRISTTTLDIPTGTVGAISELNVSSYFLRNGYSVFRSVSQSCYCDLIVTNGDKIYRVEVRTGYVGSNGSVSFPKNINKKQSPDIFAVWIHKTNEVKIIPIGGALNEF